MKVAIKNNLSDSTLETLKSKHGIEIARPGDSPREKVNKKLAKAGIGIRFITSKDEVAVQAKRFKKAQDGPTRNELMLQAKNKGIKNFRILNKEELALVLRMKGAGATEEQMKEEVIDKAVARWKAGWTKGKEVTKKTKALKCKYCGAPNNSQDPDVLCGECRETFGHGFYSEL